MRLFFFIFFLLFHIEGFTSDWTQKIYALLQKDLPNATVGVIIQNLNGSVLYAQHPNTLLYPASNTKLYTAAAALYALGSDYRYETLLSQAGANSYITFTGAPDFSSLDLRRMLQPITDLSGDITLDATRFQAPFYLEGTSYDDMGWYFAAPCSAIILDQNKEDYIVDVRKEVGKYARFSSEKKPKIVIISGQVKLVSSIVAKEQCELNVVIRPHNHLHLDGCLKKEQNPIGMSFAVTDPMAMAKQVLQQSLQTFPITFQGKIKEGVTPITAKVVVRHQSAPLRQLVDEMLQNSNNLYADSMTRTLGYQFAQVGSTKQGVRAMKSILEQKTGLEMQSIQLSDGIGTRYNMSTVAHIAALLRHIYHDKHIQAPFLHALPVMGVSGSLKNRMQGSEVANHVWAKTGSMHDISALSGFIHTSHGKTLVFSIIANGVADTSKAKSFEENLLALIYSQE